MVGWLADVMSFVEFMVDDDDDLDDDDDVITKLIENIREMHDLTSVKLCPK